MNMCVVSGKIIGDIYTELRDGLKCCKFNINNLYYKPALNATEKTIIRCICYGALADYVDYELYEGANIIITGRVLNRHYIVNNTHIDRLYIGCNTISTLEQEEYT